MPLTDVQVCNLALSRAGSRATISALDEGSEPAEACRKAFDICVSQVLAEYDWPFARRHATLAQLTETRSGWTYAYALPTDLVQPLYVFNGARPGAPIAWSSMPSLTSPYFQPWMVPVIPYGLEASTDGTKQILVTDVSGAELIYTAALKVTALPQKVAWALIWLIASELDLGLVVKPDLAQLHARQYSLALAEAKAMQANAEQEDPLPNIGYITSRW